jgi:hypothetical protein
VSGGTDFPLARPGVGFNVPVNQARVLRSTTVKDSEASEQYKKEAEYNGSPPRVRDVA